MHKKFLHLLKCPNSNTDLKLIGEEDEKGFIKEGLLISKDSKCKYPIINYIPRFVDKQYYSDSFGYEWNKWPKVQFESENINKPMQGHTSKMFKTITEFSETDIDGQIIADFGCGSGRFIDLIKNRSKMVIGFDMSKSVEAARENFKNDNNVLIIQGDILNPPFKQRVFDSVYTIGVLHHIPNPRKGFMEITKTVKPGGKLACCVYPNDGEYNYFSFHFFRKIKLIFSLIFGNKLSQLLALIYSYFSAYIIYYFLIYLKKIPYIGINIFIWLRKNIFVCMIIPDTKWRILDIFDAITPKYASTHSSSELDEWYKSNNMTNVNQTKWCKTSYNGIKKN